MRLMIEQEEGQTGVTVTTDQEEMRVDTTVLLLELAKLNVMSYYLGGPEVTTEPEHTGVPTVEEE